MKYKDNQRKYQGNITYFNVKEVADFLGYAEQTVYQKVFKREIPHIKIKRRLRFEKSKIISWMQQHEVKCLDDNYILNRIHSSKQKGGIE
jgi:excisionase family DNA binding protein